MAKDLTANNQEWLDHDGKTVFINGHAYKLSVHTYRACYPYDREVIQVFADPKNRRAEWYLKTKRELGDDWSTDILESSDEIYCDVLTQARNLSSI